MSPARLVPGHCHPLIPFSVFSFRFSVKKICNINNLMRRFVSFESKNGIIRISRITRIITRACLIIKFPGQEKKQEEE